MKKVAFLLVIALCLTLCGCPAVENPTVSQTRTNTIDVHITAGKIEPGMTVKDVLVEVTLDRQPVACRVELTAFTDEGYYTMAEDEPVPEDFLVRLDVFYSLPKGATVDDIAVVMECDGGEYDGTGSISYDDNGCEEAWSHAFYGKIPEQTQPQEDSEQTQPTQSADPTEMVQYPTVHIHTWKEGNHGSISCTTDSVITYSCTCGEGKQEIVPAPGHDMREKGKTEPTCTEKGEKTMRCSRCSYAIVVEIPATGHTAWSKWEKDTGLVHKRTCSACGTVETANHNVPSGDVICTDCGAAIIN